MRTDQIFVYGLLAPIFAIARLSEGHAADTLRKLQDAQIRARLAGMEVADGVHWAEQYMRDGTYKAYHLGKPTQGKWVVRDGEPCLDPGKGEPDCSEVWISGNKIEFRDGEMKLFCRPSRSTVEPDRFRTLKTALKEPGQHAR